MKMNVASLTERYGQLAGHMIVHAQSKHFSIYAKTGRMRVIPLENGTSYVYLYQKGQGYGNGVSAKVADCSIFNLSFLLTDEEEVNKAVFEKAELHLQNVASLKNSKMFHESFKERIKMISPMCPIHGRIRPKY